ncbi:MAG: PAS domain S-box protein [Bacteroidetes bacterium]|nr:PAS domain S-box protein [Bacteroidota bacterium]
MMKLDRLSRSLVTPRILLISVLFGVAALFTILGGLYIRIPGTGAIADPREIIVTLGSAFVGSVGGLIIGIVAGLGDPDPAFRVFIIVLHVVGCIWIGWAYNRLAHDRIRMPGLLLGWNGILFIYYFVCIIPVLVTTRVVAPEVFFHLFPPDRPVLESILLQLKGLALRYVVTAVATSLILLALPRNYRAPLWWRSSEDGPRPGRGAERYRRILSLRLTLWFLLLSLLPLTILALFLRENLETIVLEQRAAGELALVRELADGIAKGRATVWSDNTGQGGIPLSHEWFVLDTLGRYVRHRDKSRLGRQADADFAPESLTLISREAEGYIQDDNTGELLVFTAVPKKPWRVVAVRSTEGIQGALRDFKVTSFFRLAGALAMVSIVAGIVIWLIVGSPMRRLTNAVQRFGKGERDVRVNTLTMADEIEILGRAFNEMAENLGILHSGLEQEIRDRRQAEKALRESEHKFQQMAELLPQPIFEADAEGQITFVNKAAFAAFGFAAEDITLGVSILDMVTPEDRARAGQNARRVLEGQHLLGNEYRMLRYDGGVFPALVYSAAVMVDNRPGGIRGIIVDITEQKQNAEELQQALHEKEILLKEIHHRVKNNLQIISSLLNLQAESLKDPADRALFMESDGRVRSMALIHERLYKSDDFAGVDFKEYIESLMVSLMHTLGRGGVSYQVDVEGVRLSIDEAIPCGLLINELVTNALKHAFPNGRTGQITVSLRHERPGMLVLEVRDNGVGIPEDVRPEETKSLGLHLVSLLTAQLQGELEIVRGEGTLFRVRFENSASNHPEA